MESGVPPRTWSLLKTEQRLCGLWPCRPQPPAVLALLPAPPRSFSGASALEVICERTCACLLPLHGLPSLVPVHGIGAWSEVTYLVPNSNVVAEPGFEPDPVPILPNLTFFCLTIGFLRLKMVTPLPRISPIHRSGQGNVWDDRFLVRSWGAPGSPMNTLCLILLPGAWLRWV